MGLVQAKYLKQKKTEWARTEGPLWKPKRFGLPALSCVNLVAEIETPSIPPISYRRTISSEGKSPPD